MNKPFLKIGALQTILMALYHFFIPFQFQWREYLDNEIPTINWALFTINNYFSFLLLILGFIFMYHLAKRSKNYELLRDLASILLLFWIFNTIYQMVRPMPLPPRLSWLGLVLPMISGVNTVLFLVGLLKLKRDTLV